MDHRISSLTSTLFCCPDASIFHVTLETAISWHLPLCMANKQPKCLPHENETFLFHVVFTKYNRETRGRFLINTHYFNVLLHFRDMPRSIAIGISLTTVCYLVVNVAYITVLGKTGILDSSAVAVVSKN